MRIEDKAKAYDKALERAKNLRKTCDSQAVIGWCEYIFPELKESEDERIRGAIIDHLKDCNLAEWAAWLETQVPIDEEKVLVGARRDVALSIMDFLDRNTLGMCLSSMERADLESAVVDSDWSKAFNYMKKKLEKQGSDFRYPTAYDKVQTVSTTMEAMKKQGGHLENYDEAEKEKADFVGDGFIECHADFLDFKEGQTYWLEYIGDDKYNVRSDNLLGKTYHITPCQLYTVFKKLTWLEKQELNSNPYSGVSFKYNGHTWGMCARDNGVEILVDGEIKERVFPQCKSALEAIKHEKSIDPHFFKPTDMLEPNFNFKVGQWIVATGKRVYLITKIDGFNVTLVDVDGNEYVFDTSSLDDAHIWTIQDAKLGDVLVHNGCTFIFMGVKNGIVQAIEEDFLDGINPVCFGEPNKDGDYHPATKEERDLLFQKIGESIYEWDDKEKELKKVEDEEYNGEDYGIDSLYHAKNILEKTLGTVGGYQTDDGILAHQCAITAVNKLYKQKPAWSEEDEVKLNRIVSCLENLNVAENDILLKDVDWLKSLKDRYTWRPSEEQIDAIRYVVQHYNPNACERLAWDSLKTLEIMCNDLKKL